MNTASQDPLASGPAAEPRTPPEMLRELGGALRRRWLAALLVVVCTVAGAAALTAVQHKYYRATAQILIQPTDNVQSTISPGSIASQADAGRDVTTYTQMITVDPVVAGVQRSLGLRSTLSSIRGQISVNGAETSNLVTITARADTPAAAAQLASAFARVYQAYRREVAWQQINAALTTARLNPQARQSGSPIAVRITQLEAAAASETGGVQIIRPATPPRSPASPTLRSRLPLALIAGLILAIAAVLALEVFDRRLLEPRQFEASFAAPVLAVLGRAGASQRAADYQIARSLTCRDLAARLAFTDAARGAQTIMISPAGAAQAAGPFAHALAEALATVGRRVILIEADIGWGSTRNGAAPDNNSGLTAVLREASTVKRELAEVNLVADAVPAGTRERESWAVASYATLASGPGVVQPDALLGREAMKRVLAEARQGHDLVLVVTAPLSRPNQVLPVAGLCDGAIVLAPERSMRLAQAQEIVSLLRCSGIRLLGTVLDRAGFPPVTLWRRGGVAGLTRLRAAATGDRRPPLRAAGARDSRR